ncbi:MAG: ATP-binding cassette domain-containing protein [Candidatus Shapirobacteria bacterium]|nr:ATP-binding cassette domain-containing protein [Candidatus Shapirobacteria bacterium]
MISVKDLVYAYGKEPIYDRASFYVDKNQKVGLVGANGSGKSTLFKLITGEEKPDDGKVDCGGTKILVPQEVKYDPEMEKATTIRQYLDPKNQKEDYELLRIMSKLELAQFGLESPPTNLSGGQKTKLFWTRPEKSG